MLLLALTAAVMAAFFSALAAENEEGNDGGQGQGMRENVAGREGMENGGGCFEECWKIENINLKKKVLF